MSSYEFHILVPIRPKCRPRAAPAMPATPLEFSWVSSKFGQVRSEIGQIRQSSAQLWQSFCRHLTNMCRAWPKCDQNLPDLRPTSTEQCQHRAKVGQNWPNRAKFAENWAHGSRTRPKCCQACADKPRGRERRMSGMLAGGAGSERCHRRNGYRVRRSRMQNQHAVPAWRQHSTNTGALDYQSGPSIVTVEHQ